MRTRLADLIEAGLPPTDAFLEARVHGVLHFARVLNGSIEWEGALYDTPSTASIALRKTRSWNGWVDWYFKLWQSLIERRRIAVHLLLSDSSCPVALRDLKRNFASLRQCEEPSARMSQVRCGSL